MDGQNEQPQDCVQANLNPNEQVPTYNDVHINVQTNMEKNVVPNVEHLDEVFLETVEDSSDDERLTYISIYDKIKSLVDPFKKFKNTQAEIIKVTTIGAI